jgi:hypothetical protein
MTDPTVQRNAVDKHASIRKAYRTVLVRFLDESHGGIALSRQFVSEKVRERFPYPVGKAVGRLASDGSIFEVVAATTTIEIRIYKKTYWRDFDIGIPECRSGDSSGMIRNGGQDPSERWHPYWMP